MDFSIVVPIYNEKKNILSTVNRIENVFKKKFLFEIIFVDSSSKDGSRNLLLSLKKKKNIKVIFQKKKDGIGSASYVGYCKSRGEVIMQIDGDISHDPKDLLKMYIKLKEERKDMVIGSRYISGGRQIGKSFLRDIGSRFMNKFASILLKIPLKDFTHTFRLFKRKIFLKLKKSLNEKGHPSFFIQFTYLALLNNFVVCEYPVTYKDKKKEFGSNISISREIPKFFCSILKILFKRFFC